MEATPAVVLSGADEATLARARALLESEGFSVDTPGSQTKRLVAGEVVIDLDRREVVANDGRVIRPTTSEFEVLAFLATNQGIVLGRGRILDAALDQPFTDPRTIDTHVMQLRRTIPGLVIETVRGVGYRIPGSG